MEMCDGCHLEVGILGESCKASRGVVWGKRAVRIKPDLVWIRSSNDPRRASRFFASEGGRLSLHLAVGMIVVIGR